MQASEGVTSRILHPIGFAHLLDEYRPEFHFERMIHLIFIFRLILMSAFKTTFFFYDVLNGKNNLKHDLKKI